MTIFGTGKYKYYTNSFYPNSVNNREGPRKAVGCYTIAGIEEPKVKIKAKTETEVWTVEGLIDETYLSLANCKENFCLINSNKEGIGARLNSGTGVLRRKYVEQARYKLYRMPIYKPAPEFVVSLRDLDEKVKGALLEEDEITRKHILKQAVERIFELVDSRFYLLSVKAHFNVRLEK